MNMILEKYPQCFVCLGRQANFQITLHVDKRAKTFKSPSRSIPYHLRDIKEKLIHEMMSQNVIEGHANSELAPCVTNVVLAPNNDGSIRMTFNAQNTNKAVLPKN